jgi:2-C-methyl-D-erythritol 4-phosphate cytidylyltransferase / 2-C-methyl-D-erythritol 2,4-cyclodiphosphate synthase
MTCTALIVAAGSAERFGRSIPKQYALLAGKPVLRWSIDRFRNHRKISNVRVVIQPAHRPLYDEAVKGLALEGPIDGGSTRQDSVRLGLEALAERPPSFVLIHDAARPLVGSSLIDRVCDTLAHHPGAIAAMPVTDTIHHGREGLVDATMDRSGLWRAQTPQGFDFQRILAAHRSAAQIPLTDDAAVAARAGLAVGLAAGAEDNFKVTTTEDLSRAERILTLDLGDVRTGFGFDVHRFSPGDHVVLCGVSIPHDRSLQGHSDADVGMHALTDAILGTIGAGDIGTHFPPSDPRWRGADSGIFLQHAIGLIHRRGGRLANADVTFLCERPKIGPHRPAMVARLADLLGVSADRVSVKATTTEQLGFTGRGEGIAAQAAATVRLPFPDA